MNYLDKEQIKRIKEKIDGDENAKNIYVLLHEFKAWETDWNTFKGNKPLDAKEFAKKLSKFIKIKLK